MEILKRAPGRVVLLEAGGVAVRKEFTGPDLLRQRALAAREHARMRDFHEVLSRVGTGVTCPIPLELGPGPPPFVRMSRASGAPLLLHLEAQTWSRELMARVAASIGSALPAYIRAFDEPYWDFILKNFLYDPDQQVVTVLDFEVPPAFVPYLDEFAGFSALGVSLGSLVSSQVLEARRPRNLGAWRGHRQGLDMVRAVVQACRKATGNAVDLDEIRAAALLAYRLAIGMGGLIEQGWYATLSVLTRPAAASIERLLASCRD